MIGDYDYDLDLDDELDDQVAEESRAGEVYRRPGEDDEDTDKDKDEEDDDEDAEERYFLGESDDD